MAQGRSAPHPHHGADAAALLDLAYDAIFTRGFRDRKIRYWNRAAEQLYGYPAEAAVGRIPGELLGTRYPVPLSEIESELLATGRWEGELVHTDSQGRELIVAGRWALHRDADGEPIEILEINRDMTENKLGERRLRESEERFRLLVENVGDYAIFTLDSRGVITSWNAGAQRIKGYRSEEIIGRHFSIFYPPEEVLDGKPGRALALAESQGSFETEGLRVRKDGHRFWADMVISALRDERGLLRGFANVTRDMTERRNQQERAIELERAHTRRFREHAERVEDLERAKSNFLNLVSHELRTPLGILRGYLSMLEDETLGRLPQPAAETVPRLQRAVQDMSGLVEELIELARIEDRRLQLRRRQVNLNILVEEVVERLRAYFPGRAIEVSLPRAQVSAHVDPDRVGLALENLLRNAITYSPDGGEVRVAMSRDGDAAVIKVVDRGIGIPPEHLSKLFTRFGRIETQETAGISGTGLGLYLSRELASLHGGDITVESTLGRGSTFTLSLPATAPPPRAG